MKYFNKHLIQMVEDLFCFISSIITSFAHALWDALVKFVSLTNQYVFRTLEKGSTVEIYIGIIGVLISIVIFISETLKDKKNDTQRKFIIETTRVKKIMTFSLLTLSLSILVQLIPYGENNIIYFIASFIKYTCVGYSIYNTIVLFLIAIRLNTESMYFYSEYDKYVKHKLEVIHNSVTKEYEKKLKEQSADDFIEDSDDFYSRNINNIDDYIPIKADKSGIFKCYNARYLQIICEKVEKSYTNNTTFIPKTKPLILLPLKGNEKINRGVVIAYCAKELKKLESDIQGSVLYYDSAPFQDIEIDTIIKDLHYSAYYNDEKEFDPDNRLFYFYAFLYEKNMSAILDRSFEYLNEVYANSANDYNKNRKLANFLSSITHLAYSNEDYYHYKYLCDLIYICYKHQLCLTNDRRQVCYDFVNSVIRYDYYTVRKNDDSIYFDVLLSNLLNFLFDLISMKEFKAVNDLFNNVTFDYNSYIYGKPNDYDILKIQFSFGFVYGLIMLFNLGILDNEDKDNINKIINNIKCYFVDIYNQTDAIYYFKKYYHKISNVESTYNRFDFKFVDKNYKNSWSGYSVDEMFILKEYLYLFQIEFFDSNDINDELITKDSKYDYERFLKSVQTESESNISNVLGAKFDNTNLKSLLNILIKKSDEKRREYNRQNPLNEEKLQKFQSLIFDKISKGNELLNYLTKNKKYTLLKKKGKGRLGYNQLIGRDLFFDDVYGVENIAEDYGHGVVEGLSKVYLEELDKISVINENDIQEVISKLDNADDYVIITNHLNKRKLIGSSFNDKYVDVNNKKMDIILLRKAKDIYLLKRKDLPKISLLTPNINDGTIKDNIFFKLTDCANDESARNDIQKNTKWLEEKGNIDDQLDYLMEQCAFELYVFPSIRTDNSSSCTKFVTEKGGQ